MVSARRNATHDAREAYPEAGDRRALEAGRRVESARMDGRSKRRSEDLTDASERRVEGAAMIRPATQGNLRLWTPADEAGDQDTTEELGPHSTLTEVYERAYRPILIDGQGLHKRTARVYADALDWWRELTGDPPLAKLDARVTAGFVSDLLKQPGRRDERLAIGTVRKHVAQIDSLLRFVGPPDRTRRGRYNLGIVPLPPPIDRPRADHAPPSSDFTWLEIEALIKAAEKMKAPRRLPCPAPDWWRSLVVVAVYTGLRMGQLFSLRYADYSAPWITVQASTSKGRRGKRQYLRPEACEAIERIRTKRDLVFECRSWARGNPRNLQTLLKRLETLAGIPPARQFGFHGFRRSHATALAEAADDGRAGLLAAQISLGHASGSTTLDHYVAGRAQERIAASAINRLPALGVSGETARDNGPATAGS